MQWKNASPWSSEQTIAIKRLKIITQGLPPLQILGQGKRILQTDTSDEFWGAVLIEESDGSRRVCGYKSGQFDNIQKHYHSTFKEILAVKNTIKKFEFHLVSHYFIIQLDMSAFPRMLEFKQKTVPHPQLLHWQEWFSKYSFTIQTKTGKDNIVADFLSQPQKQNIPLPLTLTIFDKPLPLIFMMTPSLSPPSVIFGVQPEAFNSHQRNYSFNMLLKYQSRIVQKYGDSYAF